MNIDKNDNINVQLLYVHKAKINSLVSINNEKRNHVFI